MKRKYTTKMVVNRTNISFTMPLSLVNEAKIQAGSPWRWSDTKEKENLCLLPYRGTIEQAWARAKSKGDIVFLQIMRRGEEKNPQYKINLPRWIYDEKHLDQFDSVRMDWARLGRFSVVGRILLADLQHEEVNEEVNKEVNEVIK